jgi:death on curing protein
VPRLQARSRAPSTTRSTRTPNLALQAATLAHGIAETQPFIDGNKRAALVVLLTFLEINGSRVQASDRELADWIIAFSAGMSPHEVAEVVRARLAAGG